MSIEAKLEGVLDQEITVKKGGMQTTFHGAILVLDTGQSVAITTEAARQLRQWKEGSTVRVSGIGEALLEIEWLE
jgi:hypothetical protein